MKKTALSITNLLAFQLLLALIASTSYADIVYYNFESVKTFILFVDSGKLIRESCPGGKIIAARSECNHFSALTLFDLGDTSKQLAYNLSNIVNTPKPIEMLSAEEVTLLIKARPYNPQFLLDEQKTQLQKKTDAEQIIQKFGDQPGAKTQLDAATQALTELDRKFADEAVYDGVAKDFDGLVKTFLDLVVNPKLVELVAKEGKGTLAGAFAEILTHKFIAVPTYDTSKYKYINGYSDLESGAKVVLTPTARCLDCSDSKSERRRSHYLAKPGTITNLYGISDGLAILDNETGVYWAISDLRFAEEQE